MSLAKEIAQVNKDLKAAKSKRDEILAVSKELNEANERVRSLYARKAALEKEERQNCKHAKVIYTDGHRSWDPDEYDIPEVRICLGCGMHETGERAYNTYGSHGREEYKYKTLTAKPIRRFCVPGRTMHDTVEYYADQVDRSVKYARQEGKVISGTKRDEMLEKELNKYWEHVEKRLFLMTYPARLKAVMKVGYIA